MISLSIKETGAPLGSITQEDFNLMRSQLVDENLDDNDYYLTADTVDLLESTGVSAPAVALLRQAVGSGEGLDIRWNHEVSAE